MPLAPPVQGHTHGHAPGHPHSHDPRHDHGHEHGHADGRGQPSPATRRPPPSLLMAGIGARLLGVAGLLLLLWAAVLWALGEPA